MYALSIVPYWPTDVDNIPDLLDFVKTKGISDLHTTI
jgi:hypothetical protein